ncbi:MAG: aspartate aminotransferase family protein [Lachnospiraceae bacterium]|nr:aspartate aminotransferase family protein [Lachnospiraceae bacterium]
MNTNQMIEEVEGAYLHTYNRYKIVLEKGEGVTLYDTEGREYLDFGAGIAVMGIGYNNPRYNQALKDQIDKLIHTSNLFYNVPGHNAALKLKEVSGMDRVFFTNSGTEAIEGALKLAKKYANSVGKKDYTIIAMEHSFHGRSLGALSVTGTEHYREPFEPLIPNVKFATFNDLSSVEALMDDNTACVIMESVQGEGGIYPAKKEFIEGVRALCDKHNAFMICDEIQCGMGRTGKMFAFQNYDVKPDIITVAKALGCGVPVGAFLCTQKAATMVPGDHGTTYGGNPFVCSAVDVVLDIYKDEKILEHVCNVSPYLWEKLEELKSKFSFIKDHRGMGLIQGLEFDPSVKSGDVVLAAQKQGLILIGASQNTVRFVPPLVITKSDIDAMFNKLSVALSGI